MKDQYFGDKTDYIKHGVLRQLSRAGFNLGLHWTWTPDDTSRDGSRTSYLQKPELFRQHDPDLFDLLSERLTRGERRLRILEEKGIIPGALHHFDAWETDPSSRSANLTTFLSLLGPASLVFLDPDNGLSTSGLRPGDKGSSKYVFPEEVARVWSAGHSVILYQHFPRVERLPYITAQLARLETATPGADRAAMITSHVAFLVFLQPDHSAKFRELAPELQSIWQPHLKIHFSR